MNSINNTKARNQLIKTVMKLISFSMSLSRCRMRRMIGRKEWIKLITGLGKRWRVWPGNLTLPCSRNLTFLIWKPLLINFMRKLSLSKCRTCSKHWGKKSWINWAKLRKIRKIRKLKVKRKVKWRKGKRRLKNLQWINKRTPRKFLS